MKNKRAPGDNYKRATEKLTQTHLFYDLNILINSATDNIGKFELLLSGGKLQGGQKNAARKFKYGEFAASKSDLYRFNDTQIIIEFDQQVKSEYSKAFNKAIEFARRYFYNSESAQNIVLVQKVLFLILSDNSISDSQEFYICSDGSTKTKSDLRNISVIEFEAFLLGVWHYLIISQRLQANLKDIQDIIVDIGYKDQNIRLTYSDIDIVSAEKANFESSSPIKHILRRINRAEENTTVLDNMEEFYPPGIDWNTDIISVLKNNDIRLSRGIFFYLMANSIQTVHPKRNKNAVERLFLDLLNLTAYNNCSIDFSQSNVRDHHDKFRYLKALSSADCLDDETLINDFSDRLSANYDEILSDMIKIRKKYFNSGSENEILAVALIEFIRNDDSIDDNQEFIVCSDGTALTKAQLCEVEEIEFEPFLLDVWHYVVTKLDYNDFADEHTFDTVFKISYQYNGKYCTIYRSGNIIEEQSELYAQLIYLEE